MKRRHKKTRTKQKYKGVIVLGVAFLLLFLSLAILPKFAFADPHAMFYTDRGQEQVFYNVLAALNQADYVEPPQSDASNPYTNPSPNPAYPNPTDGPRILSDIRTGNYIATGQFQKDPTVRSTPDKNGNVNPPLETQERDTLPRIRVRQVTSDNGDAFYRESVERRALTEEIMVQIGILSCRASELIYGPTEAKARDYCPRESPSPTT